MDSEASRPRRGGAAATIKKKSFLLFNLAAFRVRAGSKDANARCSSGISSRTPCCA